MKKPENIFKGIIIIAILSIITILLYAFVFKGPSQTKQITQNLPEAKTQEVQNIETKLNGFISAIINKNQNLTDYYSESVNYYRKPDASKEFIQKDKNELYKKWDSIRITMSNLSIQLTEDSTYTALFDKEFEFVSKDNSFYTGKVKAKLIFKKTSDDWKIINETDEAIYYTEKSKSLKEFVEEYRKEVQKSKEYYLEHTESPLISVVLGEEENNSATELYENIKSTVKLNYKIKNNCVIFNEITYEYNPNGTDLPHEFCFKKDKNGNWKLYKISWAGC